MLASEFINECIKHNTDVTVFMVNGFQFRCRIVGEDSACIVVKNDGKNSIIFKSAISTISPK